MSNQLVEQLINETCVKIEEMDVKVEAMEVKIQEMAVKNHKMEANIKEVTKENDSLRTRIEELTKRDEAVKSQLSAIQSNLTTSERHLPIVYMCGYKDKWTNASSVITYDTLTIDFNNGDKPGGAKGRLG